MPHWQPPVCGSFIVPYLPVNACRATDKLLPYAAAENITKRPIVMPMNWSAMADQRRWKAIFRRQS
jgi:hypothetical protein